LGEAARCCAATIERTATQRVIAPHGKGRFAAGGQVGLVMSGQAGDGFADNAWMGQPALLSRGQG